MRWVILILILLLPSFVYAGCDDQPSNEVDWTNCNFVENLDLIGVGLANAKMSGVNLSLANLEKSQLITLIYRLETLFSLILVIQICMPQIYNCLLYTSPSPRDGLLSRMPSSA